MKGRGNGAASENSSGNLCSLCCLFGNSVHVRSRIITNSEWQRLRVVNESGRDLTAR
jgi:hypothetical protein